MIERMFAVCLAAVALYAGCDGGSDRPALRGKAAPADADAGDADATPPPPATPAAIYVRGSLKPPYHLTPRAEYGRLQPSGAPMRDDDFTTTGVRASARLKMQELGTLLARERGAAAPVEIIEDPADRERSELIPFRGNPSDVKFVNSGPATDVYVPLGGDVMTPGDEIAVVHLGADGRPSLAPLVQVGVRPQKLAVHPANLVFVCNQYSNFISILDPTSNELLRKDGKPIEIRTEHFCADLVFVPKNPAAPDPDQQYLYVANRWRRSVLKYGIEIRRGADDRPIDVVQAGDDASPALSRPLAEITGVGSNPFRLAVNDAGDALFVANNKGGELARVDLRTDKVTAYTRLAAPTADVVSVRGFVFVPTTTPDRGLLVRPPNQPVPDQLRQEPTTVTGLDGKPHVAHPGALFDDTRSYNFEDVRNGIFQLDARLAAPPVYFTDDNAAEPTFADAQKILAGALATTIVRSRDGRRVFVALGGSDLVQELEVSPVAQTFALTARKPPLATKHRPFGLALNEARGELYVADWGSEELEIFDVGGAGEGARLATVGLGYSDPPYPATTIERGELGFYDATWSNNGRKACATCHFDELDTDGVGFSNGAIAPTGLHQVKPNHNLATTDSYFWNGSFSNGSYASLAFAAQTRTNCELIEFGFVEGPASDPRTRVGDPANFARGDDDEACRPVSRGPSRLANQQAIDRIVALRRADATAKIEAATGLERAALARAIDLYSVAELRLPPNPLRQLYDAGQLPADDRARVDRGKAVFTAAGCGTCHDPANARSPFADGQNHGRGAGWARAFVDVYASFADRGIVIPQTMREAIPRAFAKSDSEVNVHATPSDFFIPFCFELGNCIKFEDPLVSRGDAAEELRKLELHRRFNLDDPDRGFIPGNVFGQPMSNTASLRGVWTQANILRHGLAHAVEEAILAPGHAALGGRTGYAVDAGGKVDVHGTTSTLSPDDVKALVRYVESIE